MRFLIGGVLLFFLYLLSIWLEKSGRPYRLLRKLITGIVGFNLGFILGFIVYWGFIFLLHKMFPGFLIPTLAFFWQFVFLLGIAVVFSIISGIICARVFISKDKAYITISTMIALMILTISTSGLSYYLANVRDRYRYSSVSNRQKIGAIANIDNGKADNIPQDELMPDEYKNNAFIMSDYDICEKNETLDGRQNCVFETAIKNRDKDLCNKLFDSKRINNCLMVINKDIEGCKTIGIEDGFYRDECLKGIAVITKNLVICNEIETASYKDGCYEAFGIKN
ncbi:MAG: hypothetical protein AABZ27_04830 [Candidatus Omnitrophota bacterium]